MSHLVVASKASPDSVCLPTIDIPRIARLGSIVQHGNFAVKDLSGWILISSRERACVFR